MTILFDQVAWAWAAGLLLAAATAAAVRVRRSWRWRLAGILLPLLAAACIALALAAPRLSAQSPNDAPVVLLLDLSPSTRGSPWRDPAWLRQLARRRLGPDRRLSLVGFDGRLLATGLTPAAGPWPLEWPQAAADPSLQRALDWRSADERVGASLAPRWILTDGLFPPPPHSPLPPFALTVVPPAALDLGLTAIQCTPSSTDQTCELLVLVRALGPATGPVRRQLRILRDGEPLTQQEIAFTPQGLHLDDIRWISVRDTLPDRAPHRYQADLDGRDPWPENDHAAILWTPPGERRVLLVSNPAEIAPAVSTIATSTVPPSRFPANLQDWQLVILNDISVAQLSPPFASESAARLDRFVRDTGGGLLFLNGEHVPDDSSAGQTLEALSPVWSRPHTGNRLHLVLLLDASASMNADAAAPATGIDDGGGGGGAGEQKFRILAQAVRDAVALLSDQDRLTVITFNDHADLLVDGPRAQVAASLQQKLAAISPQGSTVPDAALPLLQKTLAASRTLVLLVTDGEIPTMELSRWQAILNPPPSGAHATPFAVIAPARPGSALQRLAASLPGATWSATSDPAAWSAQLRQLVASQVIGRLERAPLAWHTIDPPTLTGSATPWREVWLKPESLLLAEGTTGNASSPAAAVVQRGLGQVAAISIADESTAGVALLHRVLDRITPPPGDRRFRLSLAVADDGGWRLAADGTDDRGFIEGARLRANILSSDAPLAVALAQTGPGHYDATLPLHAPFHATVFMEPNARLLGHVQAPALETSEWPASVQRTTDDLPDATRLSADLADPTQWHPPLTSVTALAPAFWLAAASAILLALWLRR